MRIPSQDIWSCPQVAEWHRSGSLEVHRSNAIPSPHIRLFKLAVLDALFRNENHCRESRVIKTRHSGTTCLFESPKVDATFSARSLIEMCLSQKLKMRIKWSSLRK